MRFDDSFNGTNFIFFVKLISQKYVESETCMWDFSFLRVRKMSGNTVH